MIAIGIDLGTTHSLIAVFRGDRPELIPNALGETLTPSAVYLGPDGVLDVGASAKARASLAPERTALGFKLDMGTPQTRVLDGRAFTPVELSALVLSSLREDAERFLGHPITDVVITVPAYFDELRRTATKDAAAVAGLNVVRIVNEPTAAAIAYGLHAGHARQRVLVMDLGGGTFDVSVLDVESGVIEIHGTAGDTRLGGDDFTLATVGVIESIAGSGPARSAVERARRIEAGERAKHALSSSGGAQVKWPGHEAPLEVTRDQVELAFAGLLARMEQVTRQALRRSNRNAQDFDVVLLVGGATRMPCVRALAERIFERAPQTELHPDEAIAMGAAVQAALVADLHAVEDLVVTDIAPFSLGIATSSSFGSRMTTGMFSVILERGTVLPASRVERFQTVSDGQSELLVRVYQGEHARCERNLAIGQYTIEGLPRRPAGGVSVDVRFSYDLSGLLDVDMEVVGTSLRHSMVIDRTGGALSKGEIEKARSALERLKVHPSETLPNRHARSRADAAFAELSGEPRRNLGELVAAFEGALETQDPKIIEQVRRALLAFVDHHFSRSGR